MSCEPVSCCLSCNLQFILRQKKIKKKTIAQNILTCCLIQARACHHEICNTWNIFLLFSPTPPHIFFLFVVILWTFELLFLFVCFFFYHIFLLISCVMENISKTYSWGNPWLLWDSLKMQDIQTAFFTSVMSLHPLFPCMYVFEET